MNATIVIPSYEPEERLLRYVDELAERGFERIVIVDDGSGEQYRKIFDDLAARAFCTVLRHERNRGKGMALKTAFAHISGNPDGSCGIVTADSDGQHSPEDCVRMAEALSSGGESVFIGVRVFSLGKIPFRSWIGNRWASFAFALVHGRWLSDTQTGLRAFPLSALPMLMSVEGDRYEYEMAVLARIAHRRIGFHEVPIATLYEDRANSTSHFRVIRDSVRIYATLLRFAGSSFLSFLVDYGLFNLFILLLSLVTLPFAEEYELLVANISARVISGCVNYYLNCRYVFSRKPTWKTAGQYFILALLVLAVNTGVLYLWNMIPGMPVAICKLLTEICVFFGSYVVQKKVIFRKKK